MNYKHQQISINRSGKVELADLYYKRANICSLKIVFNDKLEYEVNDTDLFSCFCKLRNKFPDIVFLCKGAKKNVYPSSMSREMSGGVVAYENHEGRHSTREDMVHIFDFESKNLVLPDEQKECFLHWINSERI